MKCWWELYLVKCNKPTFWWVKHWRFRKNWLHMGMQKLLLGGLNIGDFIQKSPITKVSSILVNISSYTVYNTAIWTCHSMFAYIITVVVMNDAIIHLRGHYQGLPSHPGRYRRQQKIQYMIWLALHLSHSITHQSTMKRFRQRNSQESTAFRLPLTGLSPITPQTQHASG